MMPRLRYGPEYPDITYVPHKYEEHLFDTGEIKMNYAVTGSPDRPAVVLIPAQTESWWGYEAAMGLLAEHFQAYAVDLRGQGRSSRTPGRYTFDNMGNDLVRFMTFVVGRPCVVAGLSSGGVVAAWLSAYAPPGMLRGAYYEDPPLFASEVTPRFGPSIRQTTLFPGFPATSAFLGDQWRVGDWQGMVDAQKETGQGGPSRFGSDAEVPQALKEYDPEWARACYEGTISASCDHATMLSRVKCPVLFTRHAKFLATKWGTPMGAVSDEQMEQIEKLIQATGQSFTFHEFPKMGHGMHGQDPSLYVRTILDWEKTLPTEAETRKRGVLETR
jgi:pimeloyl-ACP methyl ester carboxylesterase